MLNHFLLYEKRRAAAAMGFGLASSLENGIDDFQTGPKTVEELIQARIKGIAKELTACFHKDKPCLRWLNFVLKI